MVNFKAGDTWQTIFIIRDTGGSKEKYNPPVSLLKQFFLKIIILHHKQRYQSNPIRSEIRSGIRSGFAVGKRINFKIRLHHKIEPMFRQISKHFAGACAMAILSSIIYTVV